MSTRATPPNPSIPYREDCWSNSETSVLIDTWGLRYLDLNRGNLRRNQWQEVADAVNSRPTITTRPPRTDVQCKNRIDTLKKKFKIEKSKLASPWPFFSRLESLLGPSLAAKKPLPFALPLPSDRKAIPFPAKEKGLVRENFTAVAAAAAKEEEEVNGESRSCSRESRGEGKGVGGLARAMERFAEVYERVEGEKGREMMEMEKERMEFVKGLEIRRMQMFVDTQVRMERIKRARRSEEDGERGFVLRLLVFWM